MKNTNFAVHISPSIFVLKKKITRYTQNPFKNIVGYLILFHSQCRQRNVHHHFVIFWSGSNPKNYLSLCIPLIFLLHLGTYPSKTEKELLYYHLYHEEASFYL